MGQRKPFANPFAKAPATGSGPDPIGPPETPAEGGLEPATAPPSSPPPAGPGEFRILPLDEIRESPTNPRRVFSESGMADLIASVKESGVHVPVVVRPVWGKALGRQTFELAAGARRLRAAKAAGLAAIPAIIREMSDVQVLELQVIENNQREDVHPIEEGQAFAALIEKGVDLASIAHRIGRDRTYVAKRLQLTRLHTYFQDLWIEKAAIGVEQALIIARLSPEQQKVLRDDCKKQSWMVGNIRDTRWLRDHLAEAFERELAGVAWKLEDAGLVPAAGSCRTCMKRTGAQSALFDDVKKDTCLDPACFEKKRAAFVELKISALKEQDPKTEPVRLTSESSYGRKRTDGAVCRWEVDELTPAQAKKLKPTEVRTAIHVDGDNAGKTMLIRVGKPGRTSTAPAVSEAQKRKAAKAKLEEAFNGRLLDKVLARGQVLSIDAMRIIALKLFERLWDDTRQKICKRHSWEKPKNAGYSDWRLKAAVAHVQAMETPAAVATFAIECSLVNLLKVDPNYASDDSKKLRAAATDLGIDVEKAREEFDAAETPAKSFEEKAAAALKSLGHKCKKKARVKA